MKRANYAAIASAFLAISMRATNMESSDFKELCSKFGISLSNGMKESYAHVGIIGCPQRNVILIFKDKINEDNVKKAFDRVRIIRRNYQKKLNKVKAFNLLVDEKNNPDFNMESCIEFMKSKGYFVHKTTIGEKIVVTKASGPKDERTIVTKVYQF